MRKMTFTLEVDLDNPQQVEAAMNAIQSVASEGTAERKPKKKASEEEEPEEEQEEENEHEDITIEDLRELTAEKAKLDGGRLRVKIKAKLEALGAKNVSELKQKHYADFKTYIAKLK